MWRGAWAWGSRRRSSGSREEAREPLVDSGPRAPFFPPSQPSPGGLGHPPSTLPHPPKKNISTEGETNREVRPRYGPLTPRGHPDS